MMLKSPAGHPAGFTVFSNLEIYFLQLFSTVEIIFVVFCRNNLVMSSYPVYRGRQKMNFVNALILFVRVKENA